MWPFTERKDGLSRIERRHFFAQARLTYIGRHSIRLSCVEVASIRQPEPCTAQQIAELFLSSLLSARSDEHCEIEQFGEARLIRCRGYGFDHEEPPAWSNGFANIHQNAHGPFVIPIVNDVPLDNGLEPSNPSHLPGPRKPTQCFCAI